MDLPAQQHTVGSALEEAGRRLADAHVPSPRSEARILLAAVVGQPISWVMAHPEHTPEPEALALFNEYVARRSCLEPVAYILGHKEFYGLELGVTPDVLVPRPETELLVEMGLTACRRLSAVLDRPLRVVDLGTGSGAIAIALAANFPDAAFCALDASAAALEVAKMNARTHRVDSLITFRQGNLLEGVTGPIDLLLANLPYIPSGVIRGLMSDVRDYEPIIALDGGPKGTLLIRTALDQATGMMGMPAMILMEIGDGQGASLKSLAEDLFPSAKVTVQHDYADFERVLAIQIVGWC